MSCKYLLGVFPWYVHFWEEELSEIFYSAQNCFEILTPLKSISFIFFRLDIPTNEISILFLLQILKQVGLISWQFSVETITIFSHFGTMTSNHYSIISLQASMENGQCWLFWNTAVSEYCPEFSEKITTSFENINHSKVNFIG